MVRAKAGNETHFAREQKLSAAVEVLDGAEKEELQAIIGRRSPAQLSDVRRSWELVRKAVKVVSFLGGI